VRCRRNWRRGGGIILKWAGNKQREGKDWIKLAHDMIRVNMVMNLRVPNEMKNYLTLLHCYTPWSYGPSVIKSSFGKSVFVRKEFAASHKGVKVGVGDP
jgi:hypothetical protein